MLLLRIILVKRDIEARIVGKYRLELEIGTLVNCSREAINNGRVDRVDY